MEKLTPDTVSLSLSMLLTLLMLSSPPSAPPSPGSPSSARSPIWSDVSIVSSSFSVRWMWSGTGEWETSEVG